MKNEFQIEVIMNPAIFSSEKKEALQVKPLLDWIRETVVFIAIADDQIHQMFFLDKTKMLVSIYQN